MKRFWFHIQKTQKGQSFVELALMLVLLLVLLTGMIEFGNLLNQYVNIVDGAREGARFGSNDDPFTRTNPANPDEINELFFTRIDTIIEGSIPAGRTLPEGGAIAPLVLDSGKGDNIIISFFSVSGGNVRRYPSAEGWKKYSHNLVSTAFTNTDIKNRLEAGAPGTGILLVEIFYHYSQILGMPYFAGVPDPILVSSYAIMPLSAAEPTPTSLGP